MIEVLQEVVGLGKVGIQRTKWSDVPEGARKASCYKYRY